MPATDFRDLIAFLEPEYTVPCRQTARLEKMYSESSSLGPRDPVRNGGSCHHHRCLDSVGYGGVCLRDRDR